MKMSDPKYLKPDDVKFCLAHIVEECGEVIAAAGKAQRWGLQSFNPTLPASQQETNLNWLLRELNDLNEAVDRFKEAVSNNIMRQMLKGPK